ncbi:MAG TPA: glycosyltransferase family 2 protein [Candidatus Saccharimonadales bacterium]|jgi:glycosyltransferase involved in cell wall biosynthesis|nr:glycosyltransferase family 2 protein [Candidatus Saccharimonadales bacterium]
MRSRLRVSIVIPAYDEERHLGACLDAVQAQTSPVFEVIVVDNNSTDRTAAVARRYPFVRVVKESQQGRVFARNTGFDAARGDIIGRIDADIRLPENWVEYVQSFYADETHKNNAWSGRGYFYNVRLPHLVSWVYALLAFRLNMLLIGHTTLWGSNMAFTREQWQAVRAQVHLRNDIHEDLDLTMHLHDAGYRITYDRGIITHAHMRRVRADRDQLWEYLQWWPRTLRLHNKWTWPVCWFFGAFLLYGATYMLVAAEWLARRAGKQPLPD